jgi:glucose-1-phosphate adenylyltransferase
MEPWQVEDYLILSGDHLYRMDYRLFVKRHHETNADVTISVLPIDELRAPGFGIMKTNSTGRVVDFVEKPKGEALRGMQVDTRSMGLAEEDARRLPYIASMGIYVFKREALHALLKRTPHYYDFGRDVLPAAISEFNVQTHLFQGYWEDVGTIESFYHANIELVRQPRPAFSFFDTEFPIYTHARFLPPSKILQTATNESIICDGCIIKSNAITHSVIGIRARLEDQSSITRTLVMGADYYQSEADRASDIANGRPPIGIGAGTVIKNAIIDKNARIGKDVKILNSDNVLNSQHEDLGYCIKSGIVIVMKNGVIPDGTVI